MHYHFTTTFLNPNVLLGALFSNTFCPCTSLNVSCPISYGERNRLCLVGFKPVFINRLARETVSWCYAFGTKSYYIDNCIKSSIFCKSNRSDVVTTLAWALCCINKTQIFDQQGRRIITGSARHTNSPLPYFSYGWEHFRILRNTS